MPVTPASLFDITRRNNGAGNASGIYDSVAPRGLGLGAHLTDSTRFVAANHNNFIGCLTRDVTAAGLSLADRVFGRTSDNPVGLEGPFAAGDPVSVEKGYEAELEGADYLWLSGTGLLSAGTTLRQSLAYLDGRLRIAQAGEVVNAVLTAVNLTPMVAGNLRVRVEFT